MAKARSDFCDDLGETLVTCWRLLARGTGDRRTGFHLLTVATLGLDGRPRVRTIVLRGVDSASRMLRFHCDRRTDKYAELEHEPRIALLGYDPRSQIQIRIEGMATLHTDDRVGDEAWMRSAPSSRVGYGTMPGPGTQILAAGDYRLPDREEAVGTGRKNFCAVLAQAESVEFLQLAPDGHRRARFRWIGTRLDAT